MRALFLLFLGLFGGVSWAGAQSSPPATPEDQVAALIREALEAPDDRGAWAGLAQGLSNLESAEGAEPIALDAAVRVADSLAFTADLDSSSEFSRTEAVVAKIAGFKAWVGEAFSRVSPLHLPEVTPSAELMAWPALFLLVLTSWWLWRRGRTSQSRGWAFFRLIRTVSRVARGSAPPTPRVVRARRPRGRKDPKVVALSLVETGMPTNEVARRTGMSQDEVSVLLAIHRSDSLPFGHEVSTPHRRSA